MKAITYSNMQLYTPEGMFSANSETSIGSSTGTFKPAHELKDERSQEGTAAEGEGEGKGEGSAAGAGAGAAAEEESSDPHHEGMGAGASAPSGKRRGLGFDVYVIVDI